MGKYNVVFFDLDHTLWDYDRNSVETLSDLYNNYNIQEIGGISLETFLKQFVKVNDSLWDMYNKGQISRETIRLERFERILHSMHIDIGNKTLEMSEDYIRPCPLKPHVIPHTFEVLDYLKPNYELYILTNGFDDVQEIKLDKSNLRSYFKGMITSESAGHKKPSKEMFEHALEISGANADETIMIGDNLKTDISGALNANIDAVFYNPHSKEHNHSPHYEITSLKELTIIL